MVRPGNLKHYDNGPLTFAAAVKQCYAWIKLSKLSINLPHLIIIIIIIIIIFSIYIAQINIQEDMIKCALYNKIKYEITMLPIYNFEFTIKCEDVYYMKN